MAQAGTTAPATPTVTAPPSAAGVDVSDVPDNLVWHDVREWGVEGKGWPADETERFFDRLPARAKDVVRPPVWDLSRHSAGMCTAFETDAVDIWARWTLLRPQLAMPHMPATGVSGLDLYARDERGRWRWAGVGRPLGFPQNTTLLGQGLAPGRRACAVYLPLYNGVEALEIGVPRGAAFEPLPPRAARPLVCYGTSILQGGCASRPGMAHVAILGRRLDRPTINLGFSGNGRTEPEVAAFMAEVDAALYVVDCVANTPADVLEPNTVEVVQTLRAAHPRTPVVLVEDRTCADAPVRPARREAHTAKRRALRAAFERLRDAGMDNLVYVPGDTLVGDDGEATVDGSHPTDLGFLRIADALEPVLRALL